jgi:uncharacterized protein (TIGR02145 family)
MNKIKFISLTAGLVLAMSFTFSCSGDDGNESGNSFSYCLINEQCLDGPFTSKECGDLGGLPSNSCNGGGSSSSGGGGNGNSITYGNDTYPIVVIGTQTWLAKNLNYAVAGSKCYGEGGGVVIGWDENDWPITKTLSETEVQANCVKYGRLYDWSTATALPPSCNESSCSSQIQTKHKGICPSGWHLPTDAEWTTLTDYVGGAETAGTKLKAKSDWNENGNGTNDYGFLALPGGVFGHWSNCWGSEGSSPDSSDDSDNCEYGSGFSNVGEYGSWWSANEKNSSDAFGWFMSYSDDGIGRMDPDKPTLLSVRCIKDN